jgi:hypothetical protein
MFVEYSEGLGFKYNEIETIVFFVWINVGWEWRFYFIFRNFYTGFLRTSFPSPLQFDDPMGIFPVLSMMHW